VQTAIKMCRDRGRLVIVGIMPLEMPHGEMYMKELKLIMARAYGPGSYDANYEKRGHDYPFLRALDGKPQYGGISAAAGDETN
jgi:hypothetical protein